MIAKDEGEMIEGALKSVRKTDEIVVVDTGSTDSTQKIARKFTSLVFSEPWTDDFSASRNSAKARATGDWVLSLDADHRIISSIAEIKTEIVRAEEARCNAIALQDQAQRWRTVLWKNLPSIHWMGEAHENLFENQSILNGMRGSLRRECLYSPAHKLDPDRYIRILSKQVALNPDHARNLYYLAREYWYRKDYANAGKLFLRCTQHSKFPAEKADAWLYIAKILWLEKRGSEARDACMKALIVNANFKEALMLMAEMSFPNNAVAWKKFAEQSTNEGALFIRG